MIDASTPQPAILEDRSISIERATLYVFVLAGPLAALQALAFAAVWGWPALGLGSEVTINLGAALAALALGIVAHELIHGLAWMVFGGLSLRDIKFGFQLKSLSPYAHARVPLRARAYRIGGAAPLVLVGILPWAAGLLAGHGGLAAFGIFFTLAAGGDLAVLWLLRGVPAHAWVRDHPSRAGCFVVAPDPRHD